MEIDKAKSVALAYFRYEDLRTLIKDLKSDHFTKPDESVVGIKVPVRWLPIIWEVAERELEKYENQINDL